jgi:hypothetical protein
VRLLLNLNLNLNLNLWSYPALDRALFRKPFQKPFSSSFRSLRGLMYLSLPIELNLAPNGRVEPPGRPVGR